MPVSQGYNSSTAWGKNPAGKRLLSKKDIHDIAAGQLQSQEVWRDLWTSVDYRIRVPVIQENAWRTCYGSTKNMIKELGLKISL